MVLFRDKKHLRKETAGGEGKGKAQEWRVFDAVICMRAEGRHIADTGPPCQHHVVTNKWARESHISEANFLEFLEPER